MAWTREVPAIEGLLDRPQAERLRWRARGLAFELAVYGPYVVPTTVGIGRLKRFVTSECPT